MRNLTAVVLAGGEGRRLRPLTAHRPKPMLPAANKPILEHVLDRLVDAGIANITVVVGYGRDRVRSHFGSTHRNVPLTYVIQERQLGTGHALLEAASTVDGPFLALNGDQIVDDDLIEDVVSAHGSGAIATLGLVRRPNVGRYGGVILENGRVREIVENPTDDRDYRLNAGVYVFEPPIVDAIRRSDPRDGEYLLVDAISEAIDSGEEVRGVVSDGFWVDATYPWDLLDVSFGLFEAGIVDGGHDSSVASSATVHDSAVIREPVVVASDCEIGPGAIVGPRVCLGENATIGSNAVVETSVIDADTRIESNATVADCVTGVGVQIGSGTTIPGGPGDVRVGNRVFEDEDLGALLADRVRDRGGVSYVPGAIVGPNSEVDAGSTVRGTVEGDAEVRS